MPKQFLESPRKEFRNTTHQWMPHDTKENYIKKKNLYKPEDISYDYNNYGFRCDDFEDYQKHPIRVLFTGCSLTEGIGLPVEHTWAKLFHNKMCEDLGEKIPYWNIGLGGTGTDHMLRYLYHVGDLLQPQVIISYLPNVERRERWDGETFGPWTLLYDRDPGTELMINEELAYYQTTKNLAMINLLLDQWNSTMFCTLVDQNMRDVFDNLDNIKVKRSLILRQIYQPARDNLHPGPKPNELFADEMFQEFWPNIKDRLTIKF